MKKISINQNSLILCYKLLHDALLLVLFTFAIVLIVDGLLPEIITINVSFSKIAAILIAIICAITYLGKKLNISYSHKKINKNKILPFLILFAFLIIGNSLILFTLWQNILITLTTLLIFYLFFELFFAVEKN